MADIDSLKEEYRSNLTQCIQRVKTELDNKASADDLTELQTQVDIIKTNGSATKYTLPTASETDLGGVKVDGSTITVTNGVIKSKQATIDSTLNSTSTNAIQNKAVNAALLNKQDKLTAGNNVTIANNKISVDLTLSTATDEEIKNHIASLYE